MTIEPYKNHYADLKEKRGYYSVALGAAPEDNKIYDYYLNMMGIVVETRRTDADYNPNRFPFSVGAKQELTKIIMLIQEDSAKTALTQANLQLLPKKKWWRKK